MSNPIQIDRQHVITICKALKNASETLAQEHIKPDFWQWDGDTHGDYEAARLHDEEWDDMVSELSLLAEFLKQCMKKGKDDE